MIWKKICTVGFAMKFTKTVPAQGATEIQALTGIGYVHRYE